MTQRGESNGRVPTPTVVRPAPNILSSQGRGLPAYCLVAVDLLAGSIWAIYWLTDKPGLSRWNELDLTGIPTFIFVILTGLTAVMLIRSIAKPQAARAMALAVGAVFVGVHALLGLALYLFEFALSAWG